jgi:ATPase
MKKYVPDTSVIIERKITKLIRDKKISGEIIIHNAVLSELEAQANKRKEIGFLGLDELKELQSLKKSKKIKIRFVGKRPTSDQIKFAKAGEIDALIRDLAFTESATLITADKVQSESAQAYGLNVKFIAQKKPKEGLEIEKFFDKETMSVHLKENAIPVAKRGKPGNWKLVKLRKKKLSKGRMDELAKDIIEKTKMDPNSFVEISRKGSTIVQYQKYRIVIVRPPVAEGTEITIIKPITKLSLKDYKMPEEILERIKTKARGILIAGEVGSGKSTFAQGIAEFYAENGKITKTVESPRDLQLSENITQYSKSFTTSEEIHDILFLSRPDNIIFDEIRDTPDFKLFSDLRLGGSNCLGVIHSASAIDSVQRFISRLEVGTIPSVIDTILFMDSGEITSVLTLQITVKVPSGMTESDLARPVIEVYDFIENKLAYEIYSYGEQTVIIPISKEKSPTMELAEKQLEREIKQYSNKSKVEIISPTRAIIYVPEREIPAIIGQGGKRIHGIEQHLGIKLTVKTLEEKKESTKFNTNETKKYVIFEFSKSLSKKSAEFSLEDNFLFSAIVSNKGEIKIHKKSEIGRKLMDALDTSKKVEILI